MTINIPVFEVYAVLVVFFILKWIPFLLVMAIIAKVIQNSKQKIEEKINGFENLMKQEQEEK